MKRLLDEFKTLKKFDIAWLIFSVIAIVITTIFTNNTVIGIVSSITGVIYVILNGCRLSSAFLFGIVNTLLYGITAYQNGLYGDFMLNVFYSCPCCIIGFIAWFKASKKENNAIASVQDLTAKQRLILFGSILAAVMLYRFLLVYLNDTQPTIDAMTTILSISAYICLILRKTDTWYLFNCANLLSIFMWFVNYKQNNANLALLMMFLIYTVNSFMNTFKWEMARKCT